MEIKSPDELLNYPSQTNSYDYNAQQRVSSSSNDWILWVNYTNTVKNNGWSQLEIHTNPSIESNGHSSDSIQAYFAGYVEGFLTASLISDHYHNLLHGYCDGEATFCDKVTRYLERNLDFLTRESSTKRGNDSYWHQVGLMLEQLSGLEDGYRVAVSSSPITRDANKLVFDTQGPRILDPKVLARRPPPGQGPGSAHGFGPSKNRDLSNVGSLLWLNLIAELFDLEYVFDRINITNADEDGYCSALIKLLPEKKELFVAHNSWISYNYMLRMLKKYDFHYHETNSLSSGIVSNCEVAFSGYPGIIFSIDDFYILSSGLVVTETSIQNNNPDLNKFVDKPDEIVLQFIRTMVSNRLAVGGKTWADTFSRYNSGTYNNQFLIIDYNKFDQWTHHKSGLGAAYHGPNDQSDRVTLSGTKGRSENSDILWIVEQMPGMTEKGDITHILLSKQYFASYNRPFFDNIYKASATQSLIDKNGDYYSYDHTPRALIFARDHSLVTDLSTMYLLMRYNDFKNDPLSRCSTCSPPYTAIAAISSRSDLNDPNGIYPFPALGFRGSGAIDAKITTAEMMKRLELVAINSPTYENQPVFSWSTTDPIIAHKLRHKGHPETFNFKPQHVRWFPQGTRDISL